MCLSVVLLPLSAFIVIVLFTLIVIGKFYRVLSTCMLFYCEPALSWPPVYAVMGTMVNYGYRDVKVE